MSKASAIVSILVAFVGGFMIGNIVGSDGAESEEISAGAAEAVEGIEEKDGPERFNVPVTSAQPRKGPEDALVTIVQYSDYQCPFCKRVEPTIDELMKEYEGKLRVIWRDNPLPFHKDAMPAAEGALEAHAQGGDAKFWEFHKLLFENQKKLKRPDLEKYAEQVGLDMAKFKKALDSNKHKARIEADQKLAQKLGARGTPAFFINGRFLSGAQPAKNFKSVIDDEIERAEALVKAGVPKKQLYATLTKKGLTEAKAKEDKPKARRQPDPKAVYKVPVGDSATKGPDDALVTIIEFSEFQCPFCKRVNPTIQQIVDTYGKDVRIAFKHNPLPFHKEAMPAAEAALEAHAQGKFWEMHDKLFENQKKLSREDLESYAKEIGLNMARFKKALDTNKHKAAVEADQKLAKSLGASGTPSFFINGRNLRGAQPFASFKAVIDEELAKAKKLVESGVPRSKVYEKTIEKGATSPQFIEAKGDEKAAADKANKPDPNKVYKIDVPKDAPRKGANNAKVVIQTFSDFECPFCSRVNPTLKQVMDEYGDKVQIVWRNYPLPFHQNAELAAEASQEIFAQAGADKFWKFHDVLFENQRALKRPDLEKYAQQVGGVDMNRFKKALDNRTHKDRVQADMKAVQKAGARIGTPSFFIDGRLLQGAQPYAAFKAAIDKALAES